MSVAPTVIVCVPAVSVPPPLGVLRNAVTVMLFAALEMVWAAVGSVMVYAYAPSPVTTKVAAVTVPEVAGSETPPVAERMPAGVSITVPPVAVCTETFPKFISSVYEILIAVRILAVAVALAVDCVVTLYIEETDSNNASKNLFIFFHNKEC